MTNFTLQLQKLREWRARREKDTSVRTAIVDLRRSLKKSNKQLSQLLEAWDEVVPTHLLQTAHPISFKGGTLEVSTDGAPTAYQLKRLIRAGLLHDLHQRCSCSLRQIRVRIVQKNNTDR